jgi:hypothetical protein
MIINHEIDYERMTCELISQLDECWSILDTYGYWSKDRKPLAHTEPEARPEDFHTVDPKWIGVMCGQIRILEETYNRVTNQWYHPQCDLDRVFKFRPDKEWLKLGAIQQKKWQVMCQITVEAENIWDVRDKSASILATVQDMGLITDWDVVDDEIEEEVPSDVPRACWQAKGCVARGDDLCCRYCGYEDCDSRCTEDEQECPTRKLETF